MFLKVRYAAPVGSDSLMGEHGVHKNKNNTQSKGSFAGSSLAAPLSRGGKAARGMCKNVTANLVTGTGSVGVPI